MHHAKAEINRAISQRQHFFHINEEIVDSEAAPVDTFAPEASLDDNDRGKLIVFYKEKPILWDTPKIVEEAAKEQKETALKDLEEHFDWAITFFIRTPLLLRYFVIHPLGKVDFRPP